MKHVCLLGTSPESRGGIGTVVRGFIEDIHLDGYEYDHIVTHKDRCAGAKLAIAGTALAKCLVSMRPDCFDLVHVHSAFGASFTRSIPFIRLASQRGLPVINHIHADDWEAFYGAASAGKQRLIAETYGRCSKVIALSQEWADTLSAILPERKIAILENFTPLFEEAFSPDRLGKTVVFMSRLEKIKGCDILPDICEAVIRRIPDVVFLICGEGSMRDVMMSEFEARGIGGNVKFLGWIDMKRKADVLKQSSLFLLPSYGEGMPMCVLEAMGLGLPVVSTRVGGIPQIVESGENGFLLEPGDMWSIADAIVKILEDENLYAVMSKKSKMRAERHSMRSYAEQLDAIYNEVLGGKA